MCVCVVCSDDRASCNLVRVREFEERRERVRNWKKRNFVCLKYAMNISALGQKKGFAISFLCSLPEKKELCSR